jgi:hypothetical protein
MGRKLDYSSCANIFGNSRRVMLWRSRPLIRQKEGIGLDFGPTPVGQPGDVTIPAQQKVVFV